MAPIPATTIYSGLQHAAKTLRKLAELLPNELKSKSHIMLLAGEVTPYRNDTDRELAFRQESNFFYLTGCNVPGSYVIVQGELDGKTPPTVDLYIPEIEEADLMWSIPPPTIDEARSMHDSTNIHYVSELSTSLSSLLSGSSPLLIHTLPTTSKFPTHSPAFSALLSPSASSSEYLLPAIHQARLLKDDAEIALIRQANAISSRAHETVMRVLGSAVKAGKAESHGKEGRALLPGEWLIEKEEVAEAIFVASCRREGAVHQAYMPIVAGGGRSSTLHYTCNCESLGPNRDKLRQGQSKELLPQVLLIDAGCEWNNHAADITRTMPVGNGGKFTPEARAIYELVHEMQAEAFQLLKPGVHWDEVHLTCHRVLVRGFQRLGIFKTPSSPQSGSWNSADAILASGVTAAFFPHGLGHSLGMDVHDVPSASKPPALSNPTLKEGKSPAGGNEDLYTYLRLRIPLEQNMVVTVEPGCYFHPHLIAPVRDSKHIDQAVLKKYEGMGGVRIEDVVLITESGYENLTTVRSDVDWVEGVCSGAL